MTAATEDDVGAAQSIESSAPAPQKRKYDPGFSRNLKIIGGFLAVIVVVVVGVVLMRSGKSQEAGPVSTVGLGSGGNVQPAGPMTPAMKEMVEEQQIAEAGAAAAKNKTYIPPDTVGAMQPVTPAVYGPGTSNLAQVQAPVARQQNSDEDNRRREGMERQLAGLLGDSIGSNETRQRVENKSSTATGSGNTATSTTASTASTAAAGKQLIAGLEITTAEMANDLKVPEGKQVYASARITTGPSAGAFLVGSARVVDEGLEISFNQMRLGQKLYRIDAIVLDETTAANAIAGNVDRKVLQRYVMPVFMAGVQGFFAAKAQVATVAVSLGTDAGMAQAAPTSEQARAAGVSEALKIGQKEVDKSAQQPIVVSSAMRTPVGILFRAPVIEESK